MIVKIALNLPLYGLFDYLPPEQGELVPGQRVMVPFGRRQLCGLVVAVEQQSDLPPHRLKAVHKIIDAQPLLSAEHLKFLLWLAHYYHHPEGEVIFAALPPRLRQGKMPSRRQPQWLYLLKEDPLKRAPKQQAIIDYLKAQGGRCSLEDLRQQVPQPQAALKALLQKGWLQQEEQAPPPIQPPDFELNQEQKAAVERVSQHWGQYQAFLLQGITGSGKTEVYIRLAEQVLQRQQTVLFLVPEIALTPQLVHYLQSRLPVPIALLHSARSPSDKEKDWLDAAQGKAPLVLGTRSALLAPLPNLGLIVVDEEHDPSYKQQEGFRYSARDMALLRAKQWDCPIVLGSATPSLESLYNVQRGRYQLLQLTRRATQNIQLPRMELIDIRHQELSAGLSAPLLQAMSACLDQGQQVMLFLNRRGYAPVLYCPECDWLSECPHCDAKQTVHRQHHKLICHHCQQEQPLPSACPRCGSDQIKTLGQGTEQLEAFLQDYFAEVPLVRIDRDTIRHKGKLEALLKQIHGYDRCILIGTQMLAKGHHFPQVALVGIINIDGGLFSIDFRAPERLMQLVLQVAGRAGRGEQAGRVMVQTQFPDHPLFQPLLQADYMGFAEQELALRQQTHLPPFSYQALIRAQGKSAQRVEHFLQELAQTLRQQAPPSVEVLGPVPALMAKKADDYYYILILQSKQRADLHALVNRLQQQPPKTRLRWSIDIDPLEF